MSFILRFTKNGFVGFVAVRRLPSARAVTKSGAGEQSYGSDGLALVRLGQATHQSRNQLRHIHRTTLTHGLTHGDLSSLQ